MFLVLMASGDPYCCGEYQFCDNEKELRECMSYNYVFNIYDFDEKNNKDLLDTYLKKFKSAYNHRCKY